ncbi:F-box protein HRT3 [Pseudocercospora fuligena]|uniref:F-box protein HRT3 n=1 Tax=Pseudocercospora fuligena TaxID=685502 RepID=A0A8H6VNC6_9PEZI|nr:F-box protein HRT3 [Pseudocercospora fuligena]
MSVDDRTSSMTAPENEAELEAFRQKWREEVSTRNKRPEESSKKAREHDSTTKLPHPAQSTAGPSTARRKDDFNEEVAPKAYHDLPDKEEQLRLGIEGQDHYRDAYREPSSALEHYEKAVEKETQGQLGESLSHYRKAFKLDDGVHESYKRKHFPPSAFKKPKATNTNPSNASATVPRTDHHSLRSGEALPATLKQLVDEFSQLRIEPPEPPTDLSPPEKCPIAQLPEEILTHVLSELAVTDVAQFMKLALVCKRLAYLVLIEQSIWKRVAMDSPYGFPTMHYDYAVDVDGFPLEANDQIAQYLGENEEENPDSAPALPPTPEEKAIAYGNLTEELLHSQYQSSWRLMFRSRPRIRFNGCYISTVNYTRAGANSTNTLTWGAPVHVVTYFRYLRFFRDGSCISLLTTSEPADVVHYLTREHLHDRHPQGSMLPQAVMRDALRGRWRLSGPHSSVPDAVNGEDEFEGDVYVETEGAVPKYNYKMHLALANAGKGARNNKLAWKGFWSYNKLTDDWGAFMLRNDKAFYWSRVKSYGLGD